MFSPTAKPFNAAKIENWPPRASPTPTLDGELLSLRFVKK
jgi:hypothetical protein